MKSSHRQLLGILGILGFLYLFLLSIDLMGTSFQTFKDLSYQIIDQIELFSSNPLIGLLLGILATSLIQSSSTTTSMVVGMVGGGALSLENAIPIIMGANIGTSITNTIVSLGHIGRRTEFEQAFAASTVHDFFNFTSVLILFPLQYFTNFLGILAENLGTMFKNVGGLEFASPIKAITKPISHTIVDLVPQQPLILLIIGIILLFISLRYLVLFLRSVVLQKIERFFDQHIFKTPIRAFVFGIIVTALVQSSSMTTSIVVPLAGAGILRLGQIYPYTLGANIGTTVTAILASLVIGTVEPVAVAFSHLLFNVCGIVVITAIRPLRTVPLRLARGLAKQAIKNRLIPIVYIITIFFVIPLALILIVR